MDDRLTARELRRVERIKSALALEESLAEDDDYDDDEIDAAAAVVRPGEAGDREVGGVDDVDGSTRAWSRRVSEDRSALDETRGELKATKKRWRRLRLVRKSAARATGVWAGGPAAGATCSRSRRVSRSSFARASWRSSARFARSSAWTQSFSNLSTASSCL